MSRCARGCYLADGTGAMYAAYRPAHRTRPDRAELSGEGRWDARVPDLRWDGANATPCRTPGIAQLPAVRREMASKATVRTTGIAPTPVGQAAGARLAVGRRDY